MRRGFLAWACVRSGAGEPMSRLNLYVIAIFLAVSEHACSFSCSSGGTRTVGTGQISYLAILVIAGAGLVLFYAGFQNYRKFRILEDTPMMPIRSIPMGLVHVRGKPTGGELLTSPITQLPCFYYVVEVERWARSDKGESEWSLCLRHVDHVPFHLRDETGKVLVDPHLAQLELTPTFVAETGPNAAKTRTLDPSRKIQRAPLDSELTDYFLRTNAQIHAEMAPQHESGLRALASFRERSVSRLPTGLAPQVAGQRLRFTEQCLLPDREYNILGTCVENPSAHDEHDRNMIVRGQNESTYVISWKAEVAIEKQTRRSSFLLILAGIVMLVLAAALVLKGVGLL